MLGRLALDAGQAAQAATHFEHALRLAEALFDPASPSIADAQLWLAAAKARLGKLQDARALVAAAKAIHVHAGELGVHHTRLVRIAMGG